MELTKRLAKVQKDLKAPKGQFNSFGKYYYRNCEDILEAVKPLLGEIVLTISDEVVMVGARYYIKATATLVLGEERFSVSAFAREEEEKKGMDSPQLTGATSSYARKYALNGLFAIDDEKDADTKDNSEPKKVIAKPTEEVKAPETFKCAGCGASVPEKVKSYSLSKHSKILCMSCQSKK